MEKRAFWWRLHGLNLLPEFLAPYVDLSDLRKRVLADEVGSNPLLAAVQRGEIKISDIVAPVVRANRDIRSPYYNSYVNTPEYQDMANQVAQRLEGILDFDDGILDRTILKNLKSPLRDSFVTAGLMLFVAGMFIVITSPVFMIHPWLFALFCSVFLLAVVAVFGISYFPQYETQRDHRRSTVNWLEKMARDVDTALSATKEEERHEQAG